MNLLKELSLSDADRSGWPWTEEVSSSIYAGKSAWPKISVITPSYNQGRFIEETIRSVLLQNYPNIEYIVMDGGSTDNTIEIIKKYEPWITCWTSEKDKGQSDAINKGLTKSTGQIITWLNSDDYLLPKALYHVGSYPWKKSVGALVGRGHKIDLDKNIVYSPRTRKLGYKAFLRWMQGNNFMQPACFFSREAWNSCGPLDENLNFCMDLDLWLKMARKYDFKRLDQDIALAYIHDDAKTTAYVYDCKMEIAFLIYRNKHEKIAMYEVKRAFDYKLGKGFVTYRSLFFRVRRKLSKIFKSV